MKCEAGRSAPKRIRREACQSIGEEVQVQIFANILQTLEVEFAEKERLSHRQEWDDGRGADDKGERLYETGSSVIFDLDDWPDIADAAKLRYLLESMGEAAVEDQGRRNAWRASVKVRHDRVAEPYITISRGEDVADPFDTWHLASAFPSLLPRGMGGPRQAEEWVVAEREVALQICEAEFAARRLVSSRNMTLEAWANRKARKGEYRAGVLCIPAIWFMLNPNDIINPIKLKLTACRTRETEEAEKFLGLDQAYKRARLAISDPVSSAIFFHREVPMFFEHYVNVGEESVFGLVSQSYGAVETNERGALHLHGLLWLQGNMHLSTLSRDVQGEEHVAYRKRVIDYVDSIFSEDLDEGASAVVRAERLVNRWNKAMAVGLRHNHDISFIVTKCKGLSLIYYVTNYAIKVEEPVWKRIVAAKELIRLLGDGKARSQPNDTRSSTGNAEGQNQTWQFLLRVANRIFTKRALSQVEVVAYFQGYGTEFTNSNAWTFLNVCTMVDGDEQAGETVMLGEAGQGISLLQAYPYRGRALEVLALYDYMSVVKLKRKGKGVAFGEVELDRSWPSSKSWIQTLRRPKQQAIVCLDGYLAMDFAEEDDSYHKRRIAWPADNIQLLRRSAEDVALDARQWGVLSGESDPIANATGSHSTERDGSQNAAVYRPDGIEISAMVEQMFQFQETALTSEEDLNTAIILNDGLSPLRGTVSSTGTPGQEQLRAIKSQQISLSREREKAIQGMQSWPGATIAIAIATARGGSEGLEQQNGQAATADWMEDTGPSTSIMFGLPTSFYEVSMLDARTLYAVNEQLRRLRESTEDFGDIPVIIFCGDFHQFRPVQERSIPLPSSIFPCGQGHGFGPAQQRQHDVAHVLWRKFTVVMLKEKVRAAQDPRLRRLLTRVRQGAPDQSDIEFLNSNCYHEGRRIPWESGITVVTPLNRNRWNLNVEATLAFQRQRHAPLRIFVSEHKWKDGEPTEEEAVMMLGQGDDSAISVPAVFMFVPGMPVVVNQNMHQGLKRVNGARYEAVRVVLDKAYPGHRINVDTVLHFGPPAGLLLASETTSDLHFVGMPAGLAVRPGVRMYELQGTGENVRRVALELRGTRTTNIDGLLVPSQCDPYSLYVQLSRCRSLDGIMLLSEARERDFVGTVVPVEMAQAELRLEEMSEQTVRQAESMIELGDNTGDWCRATLQRNVEGF
ncbi:hypothetical protein BFJ68_g17175 [Fusarium oxysporum]|uniref:Helitron helicase-like domain-containing protein n=1 Tax=Fusarium oxysporum TaxID=5507 RepID=A0A420P0G8_FUSOX|nr:hypothetical protein BFJ68_g17175 [Fusarium oxysporum]